MKVWLASTTDVGGAGRAASRTYMHLRNQLADVRFSVARSETGVADFAEVVSPYDKLAFIIKERLQRAPGRLIRSSASDLFNLNIYSDSHHKLIRDSEIDVLHLFWICNYLSFRVLRQLNKTIVWRFSDLWPLTDGYHYDIDLVQSGDWIQYRRSLPYARKKFLDWKMSCIPDDIVVIAPSRWMYDLVLSSRRFDQNKVFHIPTGIDTNFFKPLDRVAIREALGFKPNDKVILLGAVGGDTDPRKRISQIRAIIQQLKKYSPDFRFIGFGRVSVRDEDIEWMGRVESDGFLRILFNAADLYLHGALTDNFPQVVLEAQSCGLPVFCFRSTGAGEAVVDGATGLLIEIDESDASIVEKLIELFTSSSVLEGMRNNSVDRSLRNYSMDHYIGKLIGIYKQASGNA